MGMFDDIKYEGKWFQTKDFDCEMHNYYIEGGRLLTSVGHSEDQSQATAWQKEHPGEPVPKELDGFLGCMTWVETGRKDINFHGCIYIIGEDPDAKTWLEYRLKFTDGNLVEVVPIEEPAKEAAPV